MDVRPRFESATGKNDCRVPVMSYRFHWSKQAQTDLNRLVSYKLKHSQNVKLAASLLNMIDATEELLLDMPRIGTPLIEFSPKEVRKILLMDQYELRYEIRSELIVILRLYHTLENR